MGDGHGNLKVDGANLWAKGKGAAVLNHKPTKVLQLSTSNPVASRKLGTWILHQKLAAG